MARARNSRPGRRGLVAWVATVALGVALQVAPWPAVWVDAAFVRGLQPRVRTVTTVLVDAVPGSVTALLLLISAAVLVAALVWGGRIRRAALRAAAWSVALGVVAFSLTFGLGYHASDAAWVLGAPTAPDLDEQRRAEVLVLRVLNDTAALAEEAPVVGSEPPTVDGDAAPASIGARLGRCISGFVERWFPAGTAAGPLPIRVKALPAGWLLRFGFAGVVSPWLLEPHVDAGLPWPSTLAVALHELAHTAGFAREADAEAIGVLAGITCDDALVRYAAALRLAGAMAAAMEGEERSAFVASWPARARHDAVAAAEATARWRGRRLAAFGERAYDAYLRGQGVSAGMADYDRGTTVAVAWLGREGGGP